MAESKQDFCTRMVKEMHGHFDNSSIHLNTLMRIKVLVSQIDSFATDFFHVRRIRRQLIVSLGMLLRYLTQTLKFRQTDIGATLPNVDLEATIE